MITPWDVYWITRLDGIQQFLGLSGAAALIAVIVLTFALGIGFGRPKEAWADKYFRCFKVVAPSLFLVFVACDLAATFTPNTKEAVAIYMLPKIVNNEKVQALPGNAVDFLNEQMKAWVEDLRGEKKE